MLQAVKSSGFALSCASQRLRDHEELVLCRVMLSHAEPRQAMSMLHVLLMIWLATDEAVGSQSRIKNPRNLIPNSPVSVQKPKFKTQVARNGVLITVQRQVFRAVGDQPMALEPGGPRFAIC